MRFGLSGTADDWLGESPPYLATRTGLFAYAFLASFTWVPIYNAVSRLFECEIFDIWPTSTFTSYIYGPANNIESWPRGGPMPRVLLRHSTWSGTVEEDDVVLRNKAFFPITLQERVSHSFFRSSASNPWMFLVANFDPIGDAKMNLEQVYPGGDVAELAESFADGAGGRTIAHMQSRADFVHVFGISL